jgi:hypothetical protein
MSEWTLHLILFLKRFFKMKSKLNGNGRNSKPSLLDLNVLGINTLHQTWLLKGRRAMVGRSIFIMTKN